MKPGASLEQKILALFTASSIAPSGGIGCLPGASSGYRSSSQSDPQDVALQRLNAAHRPALSVTFDDRIERFGALGNTTGQGASKR